MGVTFKSMHTHTIHFHCLGVYRNTFFVFNLSIVLQTNKLHPTWSTAILTGKDGASFTTLWDMTSHGILLHGLKNIFLTLLLVNSLLQMIAFCFYLCFTQSYLCWNQVDILPLQKQNKTKQKTIVETRNPSLWPLSFSCDPTGDVINLITSLWLYRTTVQVSNHSLWANSTCMNTFTRN